MASKQEILGEIGEEAVLKFLSVNRGMKVFKSTNRMDNVKDFYWEENGVTKHGEIKTEMPFMKNNWFTFRKNQEFKCFSKDMLVCVTVPYKSSKTNSWYQYGGCIFIAEPPSNLIRKDYPQNFYGKITDMIAIPFNQEGVFNLVHRINPETEKQLFNDLINNTSSKYNG